jgi:hypothetical protein
MNYIDDISNNKFRVCNLLKESKQKGFKAAENVLIQLEEQIGCF